VKKREQFIAPNESVGKYMGGLELQSLAVRGKGIGWGRIIQCSGGASPPTDQWGLGNRQSEVVRKLATQ